MPCRIGGEATPLIKEAREEWAKQLALSVDGKDLTINNVDAAVVGKTNKSLPSISSPGNSTQRLGVQSTKSRGARGRETCLDD